jgi:hypothetical protein
MGQTMGNIGSAIGKGASKIGGGIKNTFGTGGMGVEGTGTTVDVLRDGGYSDKEIAGFGKLKPTRTQKVTRAALMGLGGGMGAQQPQQPQGGGPPLQFAPPPQIDPGMFEPADYSMFYRDPVMAARRRNPMFGG